MTLVAGNNTGTGSVTLEWSDNGGASFESSGSTYLSHDSRYPDGFGADFYEYVATGQRATRWSVIGAGNNGGRFWYLDDDTVSGHSSGTVNGWNGGYTPFGSEVTVWALGYGKDSNGDGIYIASSNNANHELARSGTDVTSTDNWTNINIITTGGTAVITDVVWGAPL